MSRTDKDRPYWVRLNDEGALTEHNHLVLGRKYYRTRVVRDKSGRPEYEDVPVYREATYVAFHGIYAEIGFRLEKNAAPVFSGPVRREALRLHSSGRGKDLIEVWTERRRKTETYVFSENYDFCTEGMKLSDRNWYAGRSDSRQMGLPCTPAFSPGESWWHFGTTVMRENEHARYYTKERTEHRGHFAKLTKLWNSGDDLGDWDEDMTLTTETTSYMFW